MANSSSSFYYSSSSSRKDRVVSSGKHESVEVSPTPVKEKMLPESSDSAARSSPSISPEKKQLRYEDEEEKEKEKEEALDNGTKLMVPVPVPVPESDNNLLFVRKWSNEKEVLLLRKLREYMADKGEHPRGNWKDFVNFLNDSLDFKASVSQVKDKLRRLKKRYQNKASKQYYLPVNSHEKILYKLSKKIWGFDFEEQKNEKKKKKKKKIIASSISTDIDSVLFAKRDQDHVVERALSLISASNKEKIEKKFAKKLKIAELEFFLKKNDLLIDQAKQVLKELKK